MDEALAHRPATWTESILLCFLGREKLGESCFIRAGRSCNFSRLSNVCGTPRHSRLIGGACRAAELRRMTAPLVRSGGTARFTGRRRGKARGRGIIRGRFAESIIFSRGRIPAGQLDESSSRGFAEPVKRPRRHARATWARLARTDGGRSAQAGNGCRKFPGRRCDHGEHALRRKTMPWHGEIAGSFAYHSRHARLICRVTVDAARRPSGAQKALCGERRGGPPGGGVRLGIGMCLPRKILTQRKDVYPWRGSGMRGPTARRHGSKLRRDPAPPLAAYFAREAFSSVWRIYAGKNHWSRPASLYVMNECAADTSPINFIRYMKHTR